MKIAVLGTGYVGLVTGVCLASKGHDVTCVELRPEVVASLNAGHPHFHEPGLSPMLETVVRGGLFRATTELTAALNNVALVLVAVGTPSEKGRIDLSFVEAAARQIGTALRSRSEFLSVIIKSTVVPGTTDTLVRRAVEEASGLKLGEYGLGMNPEFLREGNAVEDFMNPDRLVLGYEDPKTLELLRELYAPWNCEKLAVNTRTAEMIKYANNCLLATQISAANELANLAAAVGGIDFMQVLRGVHLDHRWTPDTPQGRIEPQILSYHIPGCGFGGSCFPKDVQALRTHGTSNGVATPMLDAVLTTNSQQPGQVLALLQRHAGSLKGKRVLVLGLAFKPDTDDVRESVSRKIISDLLGEGAEVAAHDPIAIENARASWPELGAVRYANSWEAELPHADYVVLATRWPEYRRLVSAPIDGKVILDARRFFRTDDFPQSNYLAIGYMPRP